jgi:hypothetical protein
MYPKYKIYTLFVPAMSCAAAIAFAGAVDSGEASHLPCYDDAEKAQRFCETMGPMAAMAVYRVDLCISRNGTGMSAYAVRHDPPQL